MPPDTRWKTSNYGDLLIEQWEDDVFLFNPASGHTHLLNPAAAALLAELSNGAADLATLCTRFHDPDDALDADAFAAALDGHLKQLALIGLIEEAA